jgi:hypothetical protein
MNQKKPSADGCAERVGDAPLKHARRRWSGHLRQQTGRQSREKENDASCNLHGKRFYASSGQSK